MNNETIKTTAAAITAVILVIIVMAFYLFPWLLPLFYDLPEGLTLPYYALLVAIEMAPHMQYFKRPLKDNNTTSDSKIDSEE